MTEPASERAWRLFQGETLVGEIYVTDADFPWHNGRFLPQDKFESVRSLFDEELALIEQKGELGSQEWEPLYRQITNTVTLVKPDGTPPTAFLLHIKDNRAWFRWTDVSLEGP